MAALKDAKATFEIGRHGAGFGAKAGLPSGGIGSASIVVHVRGPVLCIPKSAVVIETETTVQVGVYYGLPDPLPGPDGSVTPVDSVAGCPADAAVTGSVLVPLQLSAPVGDREVQSLDGTPIGRVQVVD
jgi:L-aminopeptidase/D-esterase-like protein